MKRERRAIARQRIHHLFREAERRAREGRMELANRYVYLARKIAMRYLVRIPKQYRTRFCRKCNSYLLPGRTCRVRLKKHHVAITCYNCGAVKRYPYLREIKERRKNA